MLDILCWILYKGSRIFCLHIYAMQAIDVPQSASLYRYLEKKDFENAYKIACLGIYLPISLSIHTIIPTVSISISISINRRVEYYFLINISLLYLISIYIYMYMYIILYL